MCRQYHLLFFSRWNSFSRILILFRFSWFMLLLSSRSWGNFSSKISKLVFMRPVLSWRLCMLCLFYARWGFGSFVARLFILVGLSRTESWNLRLFRCAGLRCWTGRMSSIMAGWGLILGGMGINIDGFCPNSCLWTMLKIGNCITNMSGITHFTKNKPSCSPGGSVLWAKYLQQELRSNLQSSLLSYFQQYESKITQNLPFSTLSNKSNQPGTNHRFTI